MTFDIPFRWLIFILNGGYFNTFNLTQPRTIVLSFDTFITISVMQVSKTISYQQASIVSYNIIGQRDKEYHFNYVWYILYLHEFVIPLNYLHYRRYIFI